MEIAHVSPRRLRASQVREALKGTFPAASAELDYAAPFRGQVFKLSCPDASFSLENVLALLICAFPGQWFSYENEMREADAREEAASDLEKLAAVEGEYAKRVTANAESTCPACGGSGWAVRLDGGAGRAARCVCKGGPPPRAAAAPALPTMRTLAQELAAQFSGELEMEE